MPENNMELVIYYCRGRNPKDAIIVAYLLEYYSRNPTNCVGWMCTVSKAVPLLFKYNYDDFARKLFIRCFADQGFVDQDPDKMIPKEYLESHNNDTEFRALIPIVKLKSDKSDKPKWYDNWIRNKFKCFRNNFEKYRNFEKSSLALRLVPFPGFTMNSIKKQKKKYNFFDNNISHFLSILIPRQHQIKRNEWNKLSPFSRMVLYNTNDDIYDNPAIEAVINFHWQKTKYFLYFLCLRFLIFAICFVLIIWAYLNRGFIANGNFLLVLIIVFYYLATYLIFNEVKQFLYHGFRKYFINLFNIFDLSSIILSVSVMSIILNDFQLSDGFEKVEISDASLVTKISFSVFFLWIELILYLRLIPVIGIYIYHVVIVFKTIFPFFLFILIVIFAFAHTMFILLRDPKYIKFTESTYSGVATVTRNLAHMIFVDI
ncbi:unnamed protein product [Rhizophagus irregularis]|nr:unnamed protein product [Rhizophagus irregularis]